jgi:Rrf2 family protein
MTMRLTTKGRFAVTAMIDVALHSAKGPVTLAGVSDRQKISLSYLEQLFGKLRRAGLVESVRGPGGGYNIARATAAMSVADLAVFVVSAVDGVEVSTELLWRKGPVDIRPGEPAFVANFRLDTFEVVHPSGAPATAVRVEGDNRIFGYSGDTSWTSNLVEAARGADLFVIECYSGYQPAHAHIDWPTLLDRMPSLEARKIVVTHMSESAMARDRDMRAAGCVPAHDGLVVEF